MHLAELYTVELLEAWSKKYKKSIKFRTNTRSSFVCNRYRKNLEFKIINDMQYVYPRSMARCLGQVSNDMKIKDIVRENFADGKRKAGGTTKSKSVS